MTTFRLDGIAFDILATPDTMGGYDFSVVDAGSTTAEIVMSDGDALLLTTDQSLVLEATELRLDGVTVENIQNLETLVSNWFWFNPLPTGGFGSADVAVVFAPLPTGSDADVRQYIFSLDGDPLPAIDSAAMADLFISGLSMGLPVSPDLQIDFAATSRQLNLDAIEGVRRSEDDRVSRDDASTLIELGRGADTVETGWGDDTIITGDDHDLVVVTGPGTLPDDKYIDVGTGHDRIELPIADPDPDADRLYLRLSHDGLSNGIQVTLDDALNQLSVAKGPQGSTEVTHMGTALKGNGLAVIGSEFDDRFDVTLDSDDAWLVVGLNAGNDTLSVQSEVGTVWLAFDYAEATSGADINLQTGIVANDGTGGRDLITGQIDRMSGTFFADMFVGSDSAPINYVPMGGNDTVRGGATDGDVLNFFRFAASDVVADLATGRATGTSGGADFEITLSGMEMLVGSDIAGDRLLGDELGNGLFGSAGNDTVYGRAGDDYIVLDEDNDLGFGDAGADSIYGGEGADTLWGGEGDDLVSGNDGNDLLLAGAGHDFVYGGNGADTIYTGDGRDTILSGDEGDLIGAGQDDDDIVAAGGNDAVWTGAGNDTALGEEGDDTLGGAAGDDSLDGGLGNDALWGAIGDDTLLGGAGQDTLGGAAGDDSLLGGGDSDEIWGAAGSDTAEGGAGNDLIGGGAGMDSLSGQDGDDALWGGADADLLFGGAGADVLGAGTGDDLAEGGAGDDQLYGSAGLDTLFGGTGADLLLGGGDDDSISGGAGNDTLFGGMGSDTLAGGDGDDALSAGTGDDSLYGGAGADTLTGGAGNDLLDGGDGPDVFVFAPGHGADRVIADTLDRIELSQALVEGAVDAAEVVSRFAGFDVGRLVLTFDSETSILFEGVTTRAELEAMIDIV